GLPVRMPQFYLLNYRSYGSATILPSQAVLKSRARGLSASALDDREPDIDDGLGHRSALHPIDDAARRQTADCRAVDADRCQGRYCIGREIEIAVADDGDPIGHRNAASLGLDHRAQCKH